MRVSMETRSVVAVLWTLLCLQEYKPSCAGHEGIDIGYRCKADAECIAGNGGEYSKCNKRVSICICTINHLSEDKCNLKAVSDDHSCISIPLYDVDYCDTECSPKGTRRWKENEDWYWNIPEPFTSIFTHDKPTSVCYDPKRAINSVPGGFELKTSTIPGAGLGIFTNIYIERDTLFGPYKGIFEPDEDIAVEAGYSWKINPDIYPDVVWVDAKYIAQSNWLRYINAPNTAAMENVVVVQYQGEMFYHAFKSIQPGTELFSWYGDSYGDFLGIESFQSQYYSAKSGYAGGTCDEDDTGNDCVNDENAMCVDSGCFCKRGTRLRAGICIFDGALGGICSANDGDTCELDTNSECEKGVCVCKKGYSPANGMCLRDETAGGRCTGRDGEACLLDAKTECVQGLCRCIHGTSVLGGICINDEMYQGRCYGGDDTICSIDKHAMCLDYICICAESTSAVNGVCVPEETAGGRCSGLDGQRCMIDMNAECVDGLCVCIRGTSAASGLCVMDEKLGGQCTSIDGTPCRLNIRAMCQQGICVCQTGSTNLNGSCMTDGALKGMCTDGECNGQNVICDTKTNMCGCGTSYMSYAGLCVKVK